MYIRRHLDSIICWRGTTPDDFWMADIYQKHIALDGSSITWLVKDSRQNTDHFPEGFIDRNILKRSLKMSKNKNDL